MIYVLGILTGLFITLLIFIIEIVLQKKTGKTITGNLYHSVQSHIQPTGGFVGAKSVEEEVYDLLQE